MQQTKPDADNKLQLPPMRVAWRRLATYRTQSRTRDDEVHGSVVIDVNARESTGSTLLFWRYWLIAASTQARQWRMNQT